MAFPLPSACNPQAIHHTLLRRFPVLSAPYWKGVAAGVRGERERGEGGEGEREGGGELWREVALLSLLEAPLAQMRSCL